MRIAEYSAERNTVIMLNYQEQAGTDTDRYIAFYKGDLQFIASKILSYGNQEHGFTLFGLITHGGNFVCMLAVSGGPNATRNAVHFHDDHEFIAEVAHSLQLYYNIQYIGNLHSHNDLGLRVPSGNDQRQIYNVSTKNNFKSLVQIIITYEYNLEAGVSNQENTNYKTTIQWGGLYMGSRHKLRQSDPYVKFNSYIYLGAQTGQYRPMKIKLLEGINPLREQLSKTDLSEFIELTEGEYLPFERIIIDEYVENKDDDIPVIPEVLSKKLSTLPEEILDRSDITIEGYYLTISFSVLNGCFLTAEYGLNGDCPLKKIVLARGQHTADLTKYVRRKARSDNMRDVYEKTVKLIRKGLRVRSCGYYKPANKPSIYYGD